MSNSKLEKVLGKLRRVIFDLRDKGGKFKIDFEYDSAATVTRVDEMLLEKSFIELERIANQDNPNDILFIQRMNNLIKGNWNGVQVEVEFPEGCTSLEEYFKGTRLQ